MRLVVTLLAPEKVEPPIRSVGVSDVTSDRNVGRPAGLFHGDYSDYHVPNGSQIALVAVWAGVRLGDSGAAALTTNKKTSDWLCETTHL